MDSKQNRGHQNQGLQHYHQDLFGGGLRGATRILSADQNTIEPEQHPSKQQDSHPMAAMDTSSVPNNSLINSQATIDRCITTTSTNAHSTHAHVTDRLYSSSGNAGEEGASINPSSSSFNILSHAPNTTTTLASQQIITPSNIANVISDTLNSQQQSHESLHIQDYDIKSLFECPICFDYAMPPIYQCQNGHLVCQTCSGKIEHCPTCRVPITEPSIRNLQLDKLANQFQFPCKFNFNGCKWKSHWFNKREHELACNYTSYSCPCPGTSCKWTGFIAQVMPHLSEHHKSITTLNGEDIVFLATDINLKGAVDWVMIQSCFNHHFLLVLEKQELKNGQQQFFAIVQLIGSPHEADKFRYKLELSSSHAGQVKRLQWEATPRSILDGIQSAISNYDCLVFDSRMAQHFLSPIKRDKAEASASTEASSGHSKNLGINVTIERIL